MIRYHRHNFLHTAHIFTHMLLPWYEDWKQLLCRKLDAMGRHFSVLICFLAVFIACSAGKNNCLVYLPSRDIKHTLLSHAAEDYTSRGDCTFAIDTPSGHKVHYDLSTLQVSEPFSVKDENQKNDGKYGRYTHPINKINKYIFIFLSTLCFHM